MTRFLRTLVGAIVLVLLLGLLSGPAGFRPGEQSAEAALLDEVKKLLASDAEADDRFGVSVAVGGDTAIVGAYQLFKVVNTGGAAYVFQRDFGGADNWGEVKKLTASDAEAQDNFGESVAVDGDTAVVGARGREAAYVFQRDAGGPDNISVVIYRAP